MMPKFSSLSKERVKREPYFFIIIIMSSSFDIPQSLMSHQRFRESEIFHVLALESVFCSYVCIGLIDEKEQNSLFLLLQFVGTYCTRCWPCEEAHQTKVFILNDRRQRWNEEPSKAGLQSATMLPMLFFTDCVNVLFY